MSQHAKGLAGWLAYLGEADIPVLKSSARALERLHADESLLNPRSIANVVTDDPLMTVK
ncbi:MAG: metal-dependent hydrolase, partial [Hydrogenophilales bacterium 12-61-10]